MEKKCNDSPWSDAYGGAVNKYIELLGHDHIEWCTILVGLEKQDGVV